MSLNPPHSLKTVQTSTQRPVNCHSENLKTQSVPMFSAGAIDQVQFSATLPKNPVFLDYKAIDEFLTDEEVTERERQERFWHEFMADVPDNSKKKFFKKIKALGKVKIERDKKYCEKLKAKAAVTFDNDGNLLLKHTGSFWNYRKQSELQFSYTSHELMHIIQYRDKNLMEFKKEIEEREKLQYRQIYSYLVNRVEINPISKTPYITSDCCIENFLFGLNVEELCKIKSGLLDEVIAYHVHSMVLILPKPVMMRAAQISVSLTDGIKIINQRIKELQVE